MLEMVDPMLPSFNEEEVGRVISIALLCTQASPALRPPMSRVVAMLVGDIDIKEVTSRPGYLTDWKWKDTSSYASSSNAGISTEISFHVQQTEPSLETEIKESYSPSPSEPILYRVTSEGR